MAGLANFALSPTDTQSVKSGAPAAGARSNASNFRLGDRSNTVFDAVLNNRQQPVEKRLPPDPIGTGERKSPASDRRMERSARSTANPDRIERDVSSGGIDRSKPDRQVSASDDGRRVSNPKETPQPRDASDPGRVQTAEGANDQAVEGANDQAAEGANEVAPPVDTGAAEQVGEGMVTGEIQDTQLQIEPAIAQAGQIPQEVSVAADEAGPGKETSETKSSPSSGEDIQGGSQILPGEELDIDGQPEQLSSQISPEEVSATEKPAPAEVLEKLVANSGLAAKDANVDTAARPAAPAGETIANPAKKGAGAIVPDADGAAAATDAEPGDDNAPAPKPRNADTSTAERTAKADNPSPKSSAATLVAEPGSRPAPTPGQILQGNVTPLQVDAGAAIFRASAPAAQGAAPSLPVRAIALHIASKAGAGATKFQIRLDPPELGRIDVKLEITRDGRANVQLTVDRPETLDALLRDQRGLERTLQNAGLDTAKDGLSFNLRQDARAGAGGNDGDPGGANRQNGDLAETSDDAEMAARSHYIGLSAIDIRV